MLNEILLDLMRHEALKDMTARQGLAIAQVIAAREDNLKHHLCKIIESEMVKPEYQDLVQKIMRVM